MSFGFEVRVLLQYGSDTDYVGQRLMEIKTFYITNHNDYNDYMDLISYLDGGRDDYKWEYYEIINEGELDEWLAGRK